ncbi:MAG TPA: cupredoxin domain-containing protein [Chloroflexota bacterium]|jgi:plastocyanin|nr:cupredoxin domain-containing protein [Chloroflexota bacterium]
MSRRIMLGVAALTVFTTIALAGFANASSGAQSTHAITKTVKIIKMSNGNYTYSPKSITVKVGTTIIWNNTTGTDHSVNTSNVKFGINDIPPHHKAKLTFKNVGTVKYHCAFHSYMHGVVKVVK